MLRAAMGLNRVFMPQETLDAWMIKGRIEVDGDIMMLQPTRQKFRLKMAVRFLKEVGGGGDKCALVGKVKDLEQLATLGGEHYADSVLLGEDAYQVIEGMVGEPVVGQAPEAPAEGPVGEVDVLARFHGAAKK